MIADGRFSFSRKTNGNAEEAGLDGIYVISTSETRENLFAEDTVRNYKNLAYVEQAFRTLKSIDLLISPIHTASVNAFAPISSCVCSFTTSNGTCERRWRLCCSTMIHCPKNAKEETWSLRPNRDPPRKRKNASTKPMRDGPSTASRLY